MDIADAHVQSEFAPPVEARQQVEFLEAAPRNTDIIRQPAGVDIAYVESIRSFLQRPYPVLHGAWSGDKGEGTLVSFDPFKVYTNIAVIKGKLEGFQFLRAGLRFELRINGTRFHYGQLVMAWVPLTTLRDYTSQQLVPQSLTMFPSVMVNPGPSEVGILEVPFVHPYHFIPLSSGSTLLRSLGMLYLSVLVPLAVASVNTVPSITYSVHMSMVDPVVAGFTSNTLSSPVALTEQSGTDPVRFVPEAMNFLATDSLDISIAAGMQGRNDVAVDEDVIGGSRADMLLSTIFSRPNWVGRTAWQSSAAVGQKLTSIGVNPMPTGVNTYLGNLASMSKFWTGSLRYHLRFVASGFHTGRVIVSWEPVITPTEATILTVSNRMQMVVDLQDAVDVYFTVPWMSVTPWKSTSTYNSSSNGLIVLNVLNPLTVPSGDVTEVSILMWVYGASDTRFALPRTSRDREFVFDTVSRAVTTDSTRSAPQPITRSMSGKKKDLQEQCEIAPLDDARFGALTGSFSVPSHMAMGETLVSVRDWVVKLGLVQRTRALPTAKLHYSVFGQEPMSGSAFALMQSMFVVQRGSVRYAAVLLDESALPIPVYAVGPGYADGILYSAVQVRDAAPNSIIQVPYYCKLNFVPTQLSVTG